MRTVLIRLSVALVLLGTACGGGGGGGAGGFGDPQLWGFNFYDAATNTLQAVTPVTMNGGASTVPGRLDIQVPGCTLVVNFDVQFSGTLVRLLLFRINGETTCAGAQIAQAFGTGTANANYGGATAASGDGVILYNLGGQVVGGDIRWEAFLQP
jgi:hypothetical protein